MFQPTREDCVKELIQDAAIIVGSLTLIFGALWATLRAVMPGEEKILTDPFRRNKGSGE
jgi:hypothetical protein